jgi:hypothetical protein
MFELLTPEAATLEGVQPRQELHGEDETLAVSLVLKLEGANTLLDRLSPTLRHALFMVDPDQAVLPGVEPVTSLRRSPDVDRVTLAFAFVGWTLRVDHFVGDRRRITLPACKVDRFRLEPLEGGRIVLQFRVGTSSVSAAQIGELCELLGHGVWIELEAPTPNNEPRASDEDRAARRPLPPDKRQGDLPIHEGPPLSAADIFAAQHGSRAQKLAVADKARKGH